MKSGKKDETLPNATFSDKKERINPYRRLRSTSQKGRSRSIGMRWEPTERNSRSRRSTLTTAKARSDKITYYTTGLSSYETNHKEV